MQGKRSGAWLIRYALERLPVPFTFGIPGVHVTELYDELGQSDRVRPVLVTHEGGGAFMADAVSRTAPDRIGALAIVPTAGAALAMGGLGKPIWRACRSWSSPAAFVPTCRIASRSMKSTKNGCRSRHERILARETPC